MFSANILETDAVIIDNGSGFCKVGISGESSPKSVFPTVIGHLTSGTSVSKFGKEEFYVADHALNQKSMLQLKYPVERGLINSWDDIERIWKYVYKQELRMKSTEKPLLLTEPPLNPLISREKMTEVLFELLKVPALYLSVQGPLALYSSALTTGLVVDCGDGLCQTVPVYEGYYLPHAVQMMRVSGRDITDYLSRLFDESGHQVEGSVGKEILNDIKEQVCHIVLNPKQEAMRKPEELVKDYTLPDGKIIHFGSQIFLAPEILFSPVTIGIESPGIHRMISKSVLKCDHSIQKRLYENIVLTGGSTLFLGFVKRIMKEIEEQVPSCIDLRLAAPPDRKFSIWTGGSIITSLSSFSQMWVTSNDYRELGPAVVHRRCI
ncbi:actin-related protein T2-like [Pelodytes ibericus]